MHRGVLPALLATLVGCAHSRPADTVQLRGLLGASEDGGYRFVELERAPGLADRGEQVDVDARGRRLRAEPLPDGV
ncbi:MAG: hypothetical protein ACK4N5_12485, partial [Myxococcales bacterium]